MTASRCCSAPRPRISARDTSTMPLKVSGPSVQLCMAGCRVQNVWLQGQTQRRLHERILAGEAGRRFGCAEGLPAHLRGDCQPASRPYATRHSAMKSRSVGLSLYSTSSAPLPPLPATACAGGSREQCRHCHRLLAAASWGCLGRADDRIAAAGAEFGRTQDRAVVQEAAAEQAIVKGGAGNKLSWM